MLRSSSTANLEPIISLTSMHLVSWRKSKEPEKCGKQFFTSCHIKKLATVLLDRKKWSFTVKVQPKINTFPSQRKGFFARIWSGSILTVKNEYELQSIEVRCFTQQIFFCVSNLCRIKMCWQEFTQSQLSRCDGAQVGKCRCDWEVYK